MFFAVENVCFFVSLFIKFDIIVGLYMCDIIIFSIFAKSYADALRHLYGLRWLGGDDIMGKAFT